MRKLLMKIYHLLENYFWTYSYFYQKQEEHSPYPAKFHQDGPGKIRSHHRKHDDHI